ncbi:MAG: RNA polymerase factor sigma-54 [Acidobacteriota bacterium]|nr:RNA polymerase factor sigma-54 [Blastocatellia bacterium]MDW8413595.1 RNA polymerase factor sigma-54 [Acidobacteriota bacterium]
MSIKTNLTTTLKQHLVLTPQMRQRIELLSMTRAELQEAISQEVTENPVLELEETSLGTSDFVGQKFSEQDSKSDSQGMESASASDPFEEIDYEGLFAQYLEPGYKTHEYEEYDRPSFENLLSRPMTLHEHLQWQLQLSELQGEGRLVAEAIIGNLDEDGYLDATIEEIAAMGPWSCDLVERTRRVLRTFDPVGVASLNKRECLLVQLEQKGLANSLAAKLVSGYLGRLQQYKLPEIAKELGVSLEAIKQGLEEIRRLELYPGRKYAFRATQYIEPEVYIEKIDGEYYIHFNDDGMPQLRINSDYRRLLESNETSKETKDYIRGKMKSAVELLRNIEHRRRTIYRVCESIVRRQREFLDKGIEYLKPMMLKDVAEDIEMHLSTVSRVVNGKYAYTPQGIIELRRFFTEGMVNEDGEGVSTSVIKLQIKRMIEEEDVRNPLTDDEIASRLGEDGLKVSRRTVAKYRDQMNIPGSRERRVVVDV